VVIFAHSLASAIPNCIEASKTQFSKHVRVSFQCALPLNVLSPKIHSDMIRNMGKFLKRSKINKKMSMAR
jgi:hypothetical protein